MRYYPAAAALSLALAMTASVSLGQESASGDPAALALIAEGRAALAEGEAQAAIDAYEAALAVDPAYTPIYVELAEAARANGLQGKAIRYYRTAIERNPRDFAAIAGEGAAFVERGALDRAQANLDRLESQCGAGCAETQALAAKIDAGSDSAVLAAEAVTPDATVTQN